MAADLPEWPCILMNAESDDWRLVGATEGDRGVDGVPQFTRIDGGGRWTLTVANIALISADAIRTWDAVTGLMDESVRPVAVPYLIPATQPFYTDDDPSVTYSDGATHSDETLIEGATIECQLEAPAALRATTVDIRTRAAAPFRGGERFSIKHDVWSHRLYKIIAFEQISNNVVRAEIRPPLREATPAGAELDFERPKCAMVVADPAGLGGPLTARRFGARTLSFIEAGRPPQ